MASSKKRYDGLIILISFGILFGIFISAAQSINVVADFYTQNGQFGSCSEIITGQNSVFLRSHVGAYQMGTAIRYRENEDCSTGFDAGEGKQILVNFLNFDLQEPTNNDCVDYLQIEEPGRSGNYTFCGSQAVAPYVSDTRNITLTFYSDATTEAGGFKILLTSFRTSSGACAEGEFKCDSTRCIDNSLKCDGVPHCVDETDEDKDEADCKWFDQVLGFVLGLGEHTVLAIAVLAGGAIFVTVTGVVVYHVVIKKKNKVRPTTPPKPCKEKAHASDAKQTKSTKKSATSSKSSEKHKKATSSSSKKSTSSSSKKSTIKKSKKAEQVEDDVDW